MTQTVQIEGLIETLKGIANKVVANPSGSHLSTDVEGERGSGGDLVAVLNNAARKTALTKCEVDYTYTVDGTPSVADPALIHVIGNQLGLVMLDADEVEEHKLYQINLGHPSELDTAEYPAAGHVDVKNGVVTITHVNRILSPTYEDWQEGGSGSFYFDLPTIKPDSEFVCNMGEWVAPASYASGKVTTENQDVELWLAPSGASLDDWKQFLRDNRVEIVYELDEPIIYTINPTEIKTLNCYNNVLVAYQEYVTKLDVTYIRDESKAIEALEQQGGGGFAPTLLGTFTSSTAQPAGTDLEISDCSDYGWLIVEFEKPNESMAGYNGPFRKIEWIPTDSMTEGSTQEVGVAYNDVSATSMAVTAILPMISIKDSTHVHIIAGGNFIVSRVWGV